MEFFKYTYFKQPLDRTKMERIFEQKEKTAADLSKLQESKRVEGGITTGNLHEKQRCVSISPEDKRLRTQPKIGSNVDILSFQSKSKIPNVFDSILQSPSSNKVFGGGIELNHTMQSVAGDGDETVKMGDKDYVSKAEDSDKQHTSYRGLGSKRRIGNPQPLFNSANFEKGVGVKPGSSNYPMANRIKGISKQTINEQTYYTE